MRHLMPTFSSTCIATAAVLLAVASSLSSSHAFDENNATSKPAVTSDVTPEQADFFKSKVLPLLETRCFECHGDQPEVEAELRLTSRKAMLAGGESGPVIVPGEADRSILIQAMRYETFQMPPRSKMPDEEVNIFLKWINDGAPWPEDMESSAAPVTKTEFPLKERMASHWSWKKIQRPEIPEVKNTEWADSDIDRFLLAKMEDAGVSPAPDADRRSLLRRLYFDLIGLPPTIDQQDRFLNDPSATPEAMEKVVDELLASPHFGERWARHWLDLMRYAETLGHEFDYPLPYAWRYRDYVIRALNSDVPYDQFVKEHIAGDLIREPRRHPELGFNESIIATAFWFLCEDKHAPVDVKAEEASRIDNQIDVFGKTFLGLTIACARCHDHKFDAITAEDYYALSGFLQSSRRRIEWVDNHNETSRLVTDLISAQSAARENTQRGLSQLNADALAALLTEAIQPTSPVADARIEALKAMLKDEKSRAMSHPLSALANLVQSPAEVPESDRLMAWKKTRDEAAQAAIELQAVKDSGWRETAVGQPTVVAADLRNGLPPRWMTFGAAFGQLQTSLPGSGRFDVNMTGAATSEVNSGTLSPKLRGQLHSPEFVLTHPEIQILAAGKASRVRLSIDGYVMNEFSELLFGGCRQPIDTDGEFRWIRIAGDVRRYIGHRCHLEFLDEGDGWFAVREVRLMGQSDETPINRPEICQTNLTLEISSESSTDQLITSVSKSLIHDPAWRSVALNGKLLSVDAQAKIDHSMTHWKQLAEKPQPGDAVLVMCEGSGEDEYIFIRGNHLNKGPTASRRLLTALDGGAPLQQPEGSGRMELVDRLLSSENPFPSRVMVNRVWQHLFGRGIVPTPDNFGVLGEAPTHPELLDLLADDFQKDGWSIKRLIKRLVMTRAYRLGSQRSELAEQTDPANRLLHRFSIRRLEGETLRDAILSVSGRLDASMFGPSVPVYLSSFMQGRGRPGQSGPLDGAGRRSIYQAVNRNFLNPFMLAFDTPQPATAIGRRSLSNVPAQALMLMNNEFVHQQAEVWAGRLLKEVPQGGDPLYHHALRQAFARHATDKELASFREFSLAVAADKNVPSDSASTSLAVLTEFCHVLLNRKEFLFLD